MLTLRLDVADQPAEAQEEAAPLTISLDAASYEAADVIFNLSGGTQPGELAWTTIQRFMRGIGFNATSTLGSSAVRFSPVPEGIDGFVWTRSIILHAPHPKPSYVKEQIYQLRRHLQHALDLNKDSFTLRP